MTVRGDHRRHMPWRLPGETASPRRAGPAVIPPSYCLLGGTRAPAPRRASSTRCDGRSCPRGKDVVQDEPWVAHDDPDRPFDRWMWLCDCALCLVVLKREAHERPRRELCLKTDCDRLVVTATTLAVCRRHRTAVSDVGRSWGISRPSAFAGPPGSVGPPPRPPPPAQVFGPHPWVTAPDDIG